MPFTVGQRGAYAQMVFTLAAPSGVNFTVTPPSAASITLTQRGTVVKTITLADATWTYTASSAVATYTPSGSEIATADIVTVDATMTVGGQPIDYVAKKESVIP